MKTIVIGVALLFAASAPMLEAAEYNLQEGRVTLESASTLSWGPDDVLFIGDSTAATVYAVQVDGLTPAESQPINIVGFDRELASYLGVPSTDFVVNDMLVHGSSQTTFFALTRGLGDGSQALVLSMDNQGQLETLNLNNIPHSKFEIGDVPEAEKAFVERGLGGPATELDILKSKTPQRTFAITDIDYYEGEIFVAGLSNEDFSSVLRRIPFPFEGTLSVSNIEIYHGAHGQYETRAPIRTQVIQEFEGVPYLVAAYTCTPLVVIPLEALKDGEKVFGRTVAEVGFGNTPIDLVGYRQNETDMVLLTNTNYSASLMQLGNIVHGEQLSERVANAETAGIDFVPMPLTGALQLDNLNDGFFLGLIRDPVSSALNLYSIGRRTPFKLNEFYVEYDFPGFDREAARQRSFN